MGLRITTWNIKWFGQLLQGKTRTVPKESKNVTSQSGKALQRLQKQKIAEEIRRVDPDILCIQEGPSTGNIKRLEKFCEDELAGDWTVIGRPSGDTWHIRGSQGIFFLVKSTRLDFLKPRLLSQNAWFEATEIESRVDISVPDSVNTTKNGLLFIRFSSPAEYPHYLSQRTKMKGLRMHPFLWIANIVITVIPKSSSWRLRGVGSISLVAI
ncbi:MAG: hypothetical protein AAF826_03525 [Pseudomonadota bacterium]